MRQKTLEYLESHQSATPSKWREESEWRRDNRAWLRHSQHIAVRVLRYMKRESLTQSAMACDLVEQTCRPHGPRRNCRHKSGILCFLYAPFSLCSLFVC